MISFIRPEYAYYCQADNSYIFNLNSLVECANQLRYLNPYNNNLYQGDINFTDFDMKYMNYIMNTPEAFKEYIDLIRLAYNGINVWILSNFDYENAYNVVECLSKIILEQYGYVCNIVNNIEDIFSVKDGTFSIEGIQLFDSQMEYYIQMYGTNGLISDRD